MTPSRVYTPRKGMFRTGSHGGLPALYCAMCNHDVAVEAADRKPFPDVTGVLTACHDHELARHCATISWRQFRHGWVAETTDPVFLRHLTSGKVVPARHGDVPMVRRRVAYEWLADSGRRGLLPPQAVTVRETASLVAWLGPERAASELPAA